MLFISCVAKDDTDVVLTSSVTATAIITREDETAITASPVTLTAGGGKFSAGTQLTQQAGTGRLKIVIKLVYNSLNTYSEPVYVTLKGRHNSMGF
jgi:hypothetical protein